MASTGIDHFVMTITSDVRNKAYQKDDHHSALPKSAAMTMTSASPSLGADGVQFTPEVIEEIKDLVAQGTRRDEIASRLGVSVGYLQVTCLRLGISLRRIILPNGSGRHTADVRIAHVREQKEVSQPTAPATPLAPITALPMSPGVIEVEFTTGARLRIRGPVDVPIVAAVMQALTAVGNGDDLPLPTGSICHRKDNGDDGCCLPYRGDSATDGDNYVDLHPHELGGNFGVTLGAALRPTILDRDVTVLDPTTAPIKRMA
jgi:hypothetical protein